MPPTRKTPRAPTAAAPIDRLTHWAETNQPWLMRLATVLAAAVTVLLTWPLWQVHAQPPPLPLLPLPQLPLGVPLLATLAVALWRPGAGLLAFCAMMTWAVLADQTRIQPQFVTFGLLLASTLPGPGGLALGRFHLLILWFYAGLHKLLSHDFMAQSDPWMMRAMVGDPTPLARAVFPWMVVLLEGGAAGLALLPRTRRWAVAAAVLMHLGILLMLVRADYNPSVWTWNALCALAAVLLILPWRRSAWREWLAASRPLRAAIVAMAVYPLGFYAGLADTYLSFSLYAMNAPRGLVCTLSGEPQPPRPGLGEVYTYNHSDGPFQCRLIDVSADLGAPLPPIHRLFKDYFGRTCVEGEFLLIHERRRGFRDPESAEQAFFCRDLSAR